MNSIETLKMVYIKNSLKKTLKTKLLKHLSLGLCIFFSFSLSLLSPVHLI